jgi:endoglucanase
VRADLGGGSCWVFVGYSGIRANALKDFLKRVFMKNILTFFCLSIVFSSVTAPAHSRELLFGRGVNLVGNAGYYSGSRIWATDEGMQYYLDKGMRVFRIVVAWEWIQPQLGRDLDATVLAALQREVDFLTQAGATVIVDVHNYMRRDLNFDRQPKKEVIVGESPEVSAAHLSDLWVRLALEFREDPRVMFGIMNEPHDVDGIALAATYNRVLKDIRATGAANTILLDGMGFAYDLSWTGEKKGTPLGPLVRDPGNNLVIDIHRYLDDYSAGQKQVCNPGSGSSILVESTQWARANGLRLFLGEFASAQNEACHRELRDLLAYFAANTDVWTGYTWFGAYAGQKGYHTPDQGFWYSIDPGGPDAQDFSGNTPDDPRLKILLEGP